MSSLLSLLHKLTTPCCVAAAAVAVAVPAAAAAAAAAGVLLLPSQTLWPDPDAVFASTPTANYTIKNYDLFFADLNYPLGKINHDYVKNSTASLQFPGVSVFCGFRLVLFQYSSVFFQIFFQFSPILF